MKKRVGVGVLLMIFLFSNCGIYSFSGASLDSKDETVTVKFFPNRASLVNPNLSQLFTEELKDRCLLNNRVFDF